MQVLPNINFNQIDYVNQNRANSEIDFQSLKLQDKKSFLLLYNQYSAALYGNILRQVNNKVKANGILEATFIEAWYTIAKYDESKLKIFTWLNQIASKLLKRVK